VRPAAGFGAARAQLRPALLRQRHVRAVAEEEAAPRAARVQRRAQQPDVPARAKSSICLRAVTHAGACSIHTWQLGMVQAGAPRHVHHFIKIICSTSRQPLLLSQQMKDQEATTHAGCTA
jgi:hypothetical protein